MPTERKIQQVAELEERLGRCTIAIGLDYRGLSVAQMQRLRRTLREVDAGTEMRVIKNTMMRRAAENAGHTGALGIVEEATALIFGYEDEVSAAKGLQKFLDDNRLELTVRGGYLDGAVLTAAEITELAKVPGRLELMAKLAGGLNSPIGGIAGSINSIIREVAAIIEARAAQIESSGGAETGAAGDEPEASDGGADPDDTADTADDASDDAAESDETDSE